jgi:hypothetical protein
VSTLADIAVVKTKNKRPVRPIKIFGAAVTDDPWAGQPVSRADAVTCVCCGYFICAHVRVHTNSRAPAHAFTCMHGFTHARTHINTH